MPDSQPSQPEASHSQPKPAEDLQPALDETKGGDSPTDISASDVVLAGEATGGAPSFRNSGPPRAPGQPAPLLPPAAQINAPPTVLSPGDRIDDFVVVQILGRGAFGCVYLVRQLSLDRLVALKVSANRGSEGRTMARLEHRHIVQVFSETVDAATNQRLLCMQLVSGIGLEKLIVALHPRSGKEKEGEPTPANWTGRDLLAIIDCNIRVPPVLDPSAFKYREALEQMDAVEAVAWFGGRLAEALDFAHHCEVLHRDIKPANILVDAYGRPLLADFNISSHRSEHPHEEIFGGTFAYMAPEHLRAFNPEDATTVDAVAGPADIYSLGLVLYQMLEGRLAFGMPDRRQGVAQTLRSLEEQRVAPRPQCRTGTPSALKMLERTISRCLAPDPVDRYTSGATLAEQLDGCRRARSIERQMPALPKFAASAARRPLTWLVALHVLPQVVASVINYIYNFTQAVHTEVSEYHGLYVKIAIVYNSITYVTVISLIVIVLRPIWRCWQALEGTGPVSDEQVAIARQKVLRLPIWFASITACGWYIGGLILPPIIYFTFRDPKSHLTDFMLAHCVCGLIALAYSTCGELFVILRVFYPAMWQDLRNFTSISRVELAPMKTWLNVAQFLAGAIPLAAAAYFVVRRSQVEPGGLRETVFVCLTVGLIAMGLAGFYTATTTIQRLHKLIDIMTKRDASPAKTNL
jgi:eukaryotic-like serine/threonine-protein kinase